MDSLIQVEGLLLALKLPGVVDVVLCHSLVYFRSLANGLGPFWLYRSTWSIILSVRIKETSIHSISCLLQGAQAYVMSGDGKVRLGGGHPVN